MIHTFTHKGKDITVYSGRGKDERYVDFPVISNHFKRIYHKGHVIDAQRERFEIICYMQSVDANGDQIPNTQTENYRIPVTDNTYDQLYGIMASQNMSALKEMNLRAINGICETELGHEIFPYNPINNMVPIQPVEFELDQFGNDINVIHTDGSGVYEYSLDYGQTWGNSLTLEDLTIGNEYTVTVRDNSSSWFRSKKITLK
jgi:hypothetical protein